MIKKSLFQVTNDFIDVYNNDAEVKLYNMKVMHQLLMRSMETL